MSDKNNLELDPHSNKRNLEDIAEAGSFKANNFDDFDGYEELTPLGGDNIRQSKPGSVDRDQEDMHS
jgi:hypothetical protein